MTEIVEYNKYLPSYRSLLSPNARYDYKTHLLIPLTQLEINSIVARFQKIQQASKKKTSFKMKYRSLLTDVLLKALRIYLLTKRPQLPQTLAATRTLWNKCISFTQFPVEIQALILGYVDDRLAYLNCMCTSRGMYQTVKPYLYRNVLFTSTYRFAQFISCLRLNSSLGLYVVNVDLSTVQSGYTELAEEDPEREDADEAEDSISDLLCKTLAGWRDWKYKNNPLYALHPAPAVPLTKVHSAVSLHSQSELKRLKLSKYFKRKRSHSEVSLAAAAAAANASGGTAAAFNHHMLPASLAGGHSLSHPKINKFLLNYAQSKDVPTGYVIHLINMCPNMESLNLANLTFSTDYRIKPAVLRQYQRYDLMNNYPKDMRHTIDEIGPVQAQNISSPFWAPTVPKSSDLASSASSVFSLSTLTKPMLKYNSLLPPLGPPVAELTYLSRGDKMVFLSDLNLRAINAHHLESILSDEIFARLGRCSYALRDLNMSSMIWVNLKFVRKFLLDILADSLLTSIVDGKERILYNGNSFEISGDEEPHPTMYHNPNELSKLRKLDLSNSGMYKSLGWARKIDLCTYEGQKALYRILNEEVITDFEEYVVRQRIRRGRPGENYFA